MLTIGDMIIDADVMEILQALRDELKLSGVELLKDIKPTGDNIMVTCPSHKDGQETKPSCGIHVHTGVAHCFTCGFTATLPEFIGFCFGKEKENAYVYGVYWLKRNFMEIEVEERPDIEIDCSRNKLPHKIHTYVPEMVLDQYRYIHPYLYKRKLTDEVINQFDVGYDKETDCVTFPVRDIHGNCLFVARRSVKGKWFNYPAGAEKPLYGLYEWDKAGRAKELVVCESIFNCLTCWVHGIPAIALNGTGSHIQLQMLDRLPVRSLVLCLDPDAAGKNGIERIKKSCKTKLLYGVKYVDSRDINDLENEEFDTLMSTKYLL